MSTTNVWRWHFRDEAALQNALLEYSTLYDSSRSSVVPVDPAEKLPAGYHDPDAWARKENCIQRQNSEIDRGMELLARKSVVFWRILHAYYRCALCHELDGWKAAARYAGLFVSDVDDMHALFDSLREYAVEALFFHLQRVTA